MLSEWRGWRCTITVIECRRLIFCGMDSVSVIYLCQTNEELAQKLPVALPVPPTALRQDL
jgi:aryl carrier-like protein